MDTPQTERPRQVTKRYLSLQDQHLREISAIMRQIKAAAHRDRLRQMGIYPVDELEILEVPDSREDWQDFDDDTEQERTDDSDSDDDQSTGVSIEELSAADIKERLVERQSLKWMRNFRDEFLPDAKISIQEHSRQSDRYFLLKDEKDDTPLAAIAEKGMVGNATYIWRSDLSEVSPEDAFETTKLTALRHGCIRVIHPNYFDGEWGTKESDEHARKLLEALTAPVELLRGARAGLGPIATKELVTHKEE